MDAHIDPKIVVWTNKTHGIRNYYLTVPYLHRFRDEYSALCPDCSDQEEDAEHAIFNWIRFREGRNVLHAISILIEFIVCMLERHQNGNIQLYNASSNINAKNRKVERSD